MWSGSGKSEALNPRLGSAWEFQGEWVRAFETAREYFRQDAMGGGSPRPTMPGKRPSLVLAK